MPGANRNNKLPDRWQMYSNSGTRIQGTRFVCFKVPLRPEMICNKLPPEMWFTPMHLIKLATENKIGLVIDLTNTNRYYNPEDLREKGINHVKISCPGSADVELPADEILQRFYSAVADYLAHHKHDDTLIGVHCTHGLNRTGYFVCKYMINVLRMDPIESVVSFCYARGHRIEKYTNDLVPPMALPDLADRLGVIEQMEEEEAEKAHASKDPLPSHLQQLIAASSGAPASTYNAYATPSMMNGFGAIPPSIDDSNDAREMYQQPKWDPSRVQQTNVNWGRPAYSNSTWDGYYQQYR